MRRMLGPAAVGVGLVTVTVFQVMQAAPRTAAPAKSTPAAPAERRLAAEGRVVPYPGAEVRLSAERVGRLVRVTVEEGVRVRRGELLAEIDAEELHAALDQARARVAEAEAELRLAELNRERRERLRSQGVASALELDQAVRDLDTAQARRLTARAEVTRYEAQLDKTRIVAPIAGTVTARAVDAGEMVEVGTHVVTVADLGRLRVEGEADEADAPWLRVGATVTIEVPGRPEQRWRGRVEEVADTVTLRKLKPQDPARPTDTRVVSVKVAFEETTPLRLGTTVELRIQAAD